MDYKNAGVDIEAGYESVELMKKFVKGTMRPEVLGGLGGFSGAFSLENIKKMEEPILLSGTDGCGTKVKLAFLMDKHDTIGIDAVAMCVNDVACAGGEPLFFLDYIACGKNYPEKIATIVSVFSGAYALAPLCAHTSGAFPFFLKFVKLISVTSFLIIYIKGFKALFCFNFIISMSDHCHRKE